MDMKFTQSFSQSGVDVTTDCFKVTSTVNIDGHVAVIEKTGYDASTGKAEVSFMLKNGAKVIMSAKASADAKFKLITEEDEWSDGYDDYVYPEFSVAKNFSVSLDVLGELQVKASCTDGLRVAEYVENFYDAENNSTAERAIDNINNYTDCKLYYDGTSVVQAELIMD